MERALQVRLCFVVFVCVCVSVCVVVMVCDRVWLLFVVVVVFLWCQLLHV